MEQKISVAIYLFSIGFGVFCAIGILESITRELKGKKLRRKKKSRSIRNGETKTLIAV